MNIHSPKVLGRQRLRKNMNRLLTGSCITEVQTVKNLPAMWETRRVGKIPWRKEWLPTPVSLPGQCYSFLLSLQLSHVCFISELVSCSDQLHRIQGAGEGVRVCVRACTHTHTHTVHHKIV